MASNRPFIRAPVPGENGTAAIGLAGPGSGTVVLSTLDDGSGLFGLFLAAAGAGISTSGDGADEWFSDFTLCSIPDFCSVLGAAAVESVWKRTRFPSKGPSSAAERVPS